VTGFDEAATEEGTVPNVGEFDFVPEGEFTPGDATPEDDGDAPVDREEVGEVDGAAAPDPV